jgi:hypothetical protein
LTVIFGRKLHFCDQGAVAISGASHEVELHQTYCRNDDRNVLKFVSLGLGAGAKVLIGGSHRSIALQPLSVSGQVGVNLALGVAGLTLRSAP